MRYLVFVFCSIFFLKTYAQTPEQFLVDDVENVAYVTFTICVDNDAKVSSVTLVKDKTTYTNTDYIEYIQKQLRQFEFNEDYERKNTCYDVTYSFFSSKYKEKKLSEDECNACKKFKKGAFQYENFMLSDVKVTRTKKTQKETSDIGTSVFKITWVSNCSYILTYKKTTFSNRKHLKDDEIYVEIIDLLDDDTYVCRIESSFTNKVRYGAFKKIK